MKVHFVHTSDWHLGFSQYNRSERFFDYSRAVDRVITKIIAIKPKFVLHTGDIFHHSRPNPGTIRQAIKLLNRLKVAEIPIYSVRGNHDGKNVAELERGGTTLSLLADLELINFIRDEVIELDSSIIAGIGYYTGYGSVTQLDILMSREPEFLESNKFKIVALHAFAEGQMKHITQISVNRIAELGVDYVGFGHYHIPWTKPAINTWAPGSSEVTSTNDWHRDDLINNISLYSTMLEVKSELEGNLWSYPEVISHKIRVRPKVILDLKSTAETIEQLETEIVDILNNKSNEIIAIDPIYEDQDKYKPMAKVKVHSTLSYDELIKFDEKSIYDRVDFLHLLIDPTGQENEFDIINKEYINYDLDDIIVEMSELDGDEAQEFLSISHDLLNHFGAIPVSRKLSSADFDKVLSLFGKFNNKTRPDKIELIDNENENGGISDYF
jgi:DNA repair exonuclease SbcCD nuclease subunit